MAPTTIAAKIKTRSAARKAAAEAKAAEEAEEAEIAEEAAVTARKDKGAAAKAAKAAEEIMAFAAADIAPIKAEEEAVVAVENAARAKTQKADAKVQTAEAAEAAAKKAKEVKALAEAAEERAPKRKRMRKHDRSLLAQWTENELLSWAGAYAYFGGQWKEVSEMVVSKNESDCQMMYESYGPEWEMYAGADGADVFSVFRLWVNFVLGQQKK